MSALEMIVGFVEGRVSAAELQEALYRTTSDLGRELEALLSDDTQIPHYTNGGTVYLRLISSDLRKPRGQAHARDMLGKFLGIKGVQHVRDERSEQRHALLMSAQPRWVDVAEDGDFNAQFQAAADRLAGADLRAWIKQAIPARYRCLGKPPRWLKSPKWLHDKGRPLVFVGQLDVGELHHDDAQLYVFHDERDGSYRTVVQTT